LRKRYTVNYRLADDSRATRIGKVLRATHLDEVPQLWNVIRGEMSLVGPRPVLPEESENYGVLKREILSVRPGLTGLWQTSRHLAPDYPERAYLEASYVRGWSLLLDTRLALSTATYVTTQTVKEIARLAKRGKPRSEIYGRRR
jgi:lipopolysaccharide/colanic/teichoic acid biosynthesis glycosyltransferase